MILSWHTRRGGGGLVWGQFRGGDFVVHFDVDISPATLFCAIGGPSCALRTLSGSGSQVLEA